MDLDHETIKKLIYSNFLPRLRKDGVILTQGGQYTVGLNGYTQYMFDKDQAETKAQTMFCIDDIIKVLGPIKEHMMPKKKYNINITSYGLKHKFERVSSYISNGDFILAMMVCGFYPLFTNEANPNCIFRATFQEKPMNNTATKNHENHEGLSAS